MTAHAHFKTMRETVDTEASIHLVARDAWGNQCAEQWFTRETDATRVMIARNRGPGPRWGIETRTDA